MLNYVWDFIIFRKINGTFSGNALYLEQNAKEVISMSIDRVKAYFRELGVEDKVQELEESSATV